MSRTQEQIVQRSTALYAGIDVGKNHLDVFIHPTGITKRVDNDKKAIKSLTNTLVEHDVQFVTMEATSKYHRLAHSMIHEAGITVSVVNPFRSRQFANSTRRLAKSDTIDAESLALFAERMAPEPTIPPEIEFANLRELQTARRQVLKEVCDLKRQLQTTENRLAARQVRARIAMGERHQSTLEDEIENLIASQSALKEKFDILTSVPGIGKTTAAIMLADLAELGQVNAKEIAALAGVAPMNWDSGMKNGNRMIRGGRKHVRNALYMCAVACMEFPRFRGHPLTEVERCSDAKNKEPVPGGFPGVDRRVAQSWAECRGARTRVRALRCDDPYLEQAGRAGRRQTCRYPEQRRTGRTSSSSP